VITIANATMTAIVTTKAITTAKSRHQLERFI
jgi:hypothetical protein